MKWIDEKYMVDNFPVAVNSRGDDHHSISMIRDTFLSRIKIDHEFSRAENRKERATIFKYLDDASCDFSKGRWQNMHQSFCTIPDLLRLRLPSPCGGLSDLFHPSWTGELLLLPMGKLHKRECIGMDLNNNNEVEPVTPKLLDYGERKSPSGNKWCRYNQYVYDPNHPQQTNNDTGNSGENNEHTQPTSTKEKVTVACDAPEGGDGDNPTVGDSVAAVTDDKKEKEGKQGSDGNSASDIQDKLPATDGDKDTAKIAHSQQKGSESPSTKSLTCAAGTNCNKRMASGCTAMMRQDEEEDNCCNTLWFQCIIQCIYD